MKDIEGQSGKEEGLPIKNHNKIGKLISVGKDLYNFSLFACLRL